LPDRSSAIIAHIACLKSSPVTLASLRPDRVLRGYCWTLSQPVSNVLILYKILRLLLPLAVIIMLVRWGLQHKKRNDRG